MTRPILSDADRSDVFRGLAHPLRRRVIAKLSKHECSVNELLAGLKISQPALSRHLRIMLDTGLITHRVQGRSRYYRLNAPALRKVQKWAQQLG